MAQIFCSTRRLVEDFVLDIQQKFSTRRLVVEKQLPSRCLLEGVNIYQTSSSRKIALLDVQQNFYQMSSRSFTGRLVDQMIQANIFPLFQVMIETKKCIYRFYFQISNSKRKLHSIDLFLHHMNTKSFSLIHLILVLYVIDSKSSYIQYLYYLG